MHFTLTAASSRLQGREAPGQRGGWEILLCFVNLRCFKCVSSDSVAVQLQDADVHHSRQKHPSGKSLRGQPAPLSLSDGLLFYSSSIYPNKTFKHHQCVRL